MANAGECPILAPTVLEPPPAAGRSGGADPVAAPRATSSPSPSAVPSRSARWRAALPCALFAAATVLAFADPVFEKRNFGGRDILGYNLPIEKAIHDAWSRGRLPVWIDLISGGRPLLSNPNAGAFYPVRPVFSLLPFPLAMRLYPVLHWALSGIGFLLAARALGLSVGAAWVGAATYAFSGVSISEVFFTNYQPGFTLLPWLVWALARPASRAARILSLGTVFALLFLAGDVFVSTVALLCVGLWIARESPGHEGKRLFVDGVAAVLLGGLLALPQIVAAAGWIPYTNRAILGMRLNEALLYSVSPLRLFELVIPYPFGPTWELDSTRVWGWQVFRYKTVGFFTTFYAGSLAAIGVIAAWRDRRRGAGFARSLLLLSLAVCVLPSFVPASWGSLHSPLPLRFPEKFAVGMTLALALLAAFAFDRLRGRDRLPRAILWVGVALALAAVLARLFPDGAATAGVAVVSGDAAAHASAARRLPDILAEAGLYWMATLVALELARRGRRFETVAALLVLTLVPLLGARRIALTFREAEIFSPSPFDLYQARQDPEGRFRAMGEPSYRSPSKLEAEHETADPGQLDSSVRGWDQYTHVLWNRGAVLNLDFDHGDLSRLESLRGMSYIASSYLDSAAFYGSLALKWGIRFRDQAPPLSGFRRFRSVGLQEWDVHDQAFPDMRLVGAWREVPSALAAGNALPRLAAGEIVVENGGNEARGTAPPGTLRVLSRTAEGFRLVLEAPAPTWLFVLRGYWPFRRIRLDGASVEAVPAQVAFSAVRIPAGSHRLEWEESLAGAGVSWIGPVLAVLAGAALFWRRRDLESAA